MHLPILDSAMPGFHAFSRQIGITRLADLTGLDIAGLPVVQATRPASLSNVVSQGKGPTLAAAAVSAIFEAAESFFAERLERYKIVSATCGDLDISPDEFSGHLWPDTPPGWATAQIRWVEARNPLDQTRCFVPLSLVHTCYTAPPRQDEGFFIPTTTGLAAGFTRDGAAAHAILECIERDAIARAYQTHGFFHRARIDTRRIEGHAVKSLLSGLRENGLLCGLWMAPSPTSMPVVWCHLIEDCDPAHAILPFPSEGSAARTDPLRAIVDAVREAAQSRLAAISGTRDDFTRRSYPKYPDFAQLAAHRRLLAEGPCPLELHDRNDRDDDLDALLERLLKHGFRDIREVTIDTEPFAQIVVVKTLIAGLQPFFEGNRV